VGRAEAPLSGILDSAAEELIGRAVLEKFGKFLPLVKILTPKGRLSVQFHDAKNELWIMTGINKKITGKSTELIIGFESKLIKKYGKKILGKYTEALEKFGKALNALIDEMEKKGHKELLKKKGDAALAAAAVKDSSLKGLLRHYKAAEKEVDGFYNRLKVKVGDVIPVPQGTLHALGKGIEIVEPQIPGPTQSLEDGATYPVRYYFPDFPREGASKKLDIDRVSEMRSAKWEKTKPVVVNRSKKFVTERLPGGFGAKGMEVRRTKAQAGAEIGYDGKSYHMFVLISGKAAVLSGGGKYDIPCAKAGGKMMIVPASAGKFVIRTWTRAELIDTFTPVGK
jgi:hypothetical protein